MEKKVLTENDASGHGNDEDDKGKPFYITVNEKPVPITGHRHTGLEIKQAAIRAGVSIELDFVLSLEKGHGRTDLVRDDEEVTVNKNSRFEAIPNDDHS